MLSAIDTSASEGNVVDFTRVFEGGRRWKGRCFQVVYLAVPALVAESREGAVVLEVPRPSRPRVACRWAVVASKKAVDKRATRRNRTKRRLRVLVRDYVLPALRERGFALGERPLEIVVLAGRRMVDEPWDSLVRETQALVVGIARTLGEKTPC